MWGSCHVQGRPKSVNFNGLNAVLQELFGSESASQVYAQITEWMATLPRDKLRKVKWLLYDDMCHLGIKVQHLLPYI